MALYVVGVIGERKVHQWIVIASLITFNRSENKAAAVAAAAAAMMTML